MTSKTSSMKAYLWIPLACLAGFVVGSWGARDELRAFKEHASSNETKAKAAAKQGGFNAFAQMVKIPETARRPHRQLRNADPKPISPIAVTNSMAKAASERPESKKQNAEDAKPAPSAVTNAPLRRLSPDDLRARIEEAQELWRTRVDLARAQWKTKLKLGGESEKAFDAVLQDMNERLYDSVAALAGILSERDEMTPELGLRLVGETSAILAETYDKVGACASPEMRETVSKMQMVDFIDPGVAEPLIEVQGKLESAAIVGAKGR